MKSVLEGLSSKILAYLQHKTSVMVLSRMEIFLRNSDEEKKMIVAYQRRDGNENMV